MKKYILREKSRLAVLTAFFINGELLASWVSRIPAVQTRLGVNEESLGFILLGLSAGVMTALFVAGSLNVRYGSHRVTVAGAFGMCVMLPLLALAFHPVMLFLCLFLFGGMMSIMDVAMNEQAVLVEHQSGRPLMASFHAGYSIGGMAGALIGAGMALLKDFPLWLYFALSAAIFGCVMVLVYRQMIIGSTRMQESRALFRLPNRALWLLGVIAFCSVMTESAMGDWSAVYLTRILETSASFAALGYAAYSLMMTLGRMLGDLMSAKMKQENIIKLGSVLALSGLLLLVLASNPLLAVAGFALVGLGLSNIVPLTFRAAGNYPGISAGAGIAGVASIGYLGALSSPTMIGLISRFASLRVAFLLLAVLVGSLLFTSKAVRQTESIKSDKTIL